MAHSRRLFPRHEVVLVGVNMEEGLKAAKGEVVLCGLPALIMKFIDPDVLALTSYRTVDELMASPDGKALLESKIEEFKDRYPNAGILVVSREGEKLGGAT
jgi:cobalt-precorrin-5B (C1)-methyltransferase